MGGVHGEEHAPRMSGRSAAAWCAVLALALALLGLGPATARAQSADPCLSGCHLVFTGQPADVEVGQTITSSPVDPGGPPIVVSIRNSAGGPAFLERNITMSLGTAPPGAVLNGTTTVLSNSDGNAVFDDLSVTTAGTYTLTASTAGITSATSVPFTALDGDVTCANNLACSASAAVSGFAPGTGAPYTNTVVVEAAPNPSPGVPDDGGSLTVAYNIGPNFTCGATGLVSPDREVINGPNREKTVRSTIHKALLDAAGRSASSLRTCLVAPYRFNLGLPLIGGRATPLGDIDGDSNPDFSGLLPTCIPLPFPILGQTSLIGPPCQVSARADAMGNGVVTYRLPADPRDPAARH
jgi:hypothetical protein